jgi:UDP-glucose 4-epimerase
MRILVTGGAGFIASHIVDAYIDAGHQVAILDNFSSGSQQNVNPLAAVHHVDIRDRERVERIFQEGSFDLLNHHAAQLDVRVSVRDPQLDAEQNVIGTLNLLQGALKNGVRRVVFASTGGAVYGEQEYFPADEGHPTNPISPYGVTKLAAEKYLHYFRAVHGIQHVVFRYTNVYGPRQNPHGEAGVIAVFCDRMFNGHQPTINGSGEQTRDYVYVGDLVRAHMMALDFMEEGRSETFNLCTNTETTVNRLFHTLNDMLGGKFVERHGPASQGEQLRSVCSYDRAAKQLGWKPEVELAEGLRRTLEFYSASGSVRA